MQPHLPRRLALTRTARLAGGLVGLATIPLLSACGGGDGDNTQLTVAEQIRFDSRYSILNEALIASGLNATLAGGGPFTLFAPTDAAFAALLAELGLTQAQLLGNVPLDRRHCLAQRHRSPQHAGGQHVVRQHGREQGLRCRWARQ